MSIDFKKSCLDLVCLHCFTLLIRGGVAIGTIRSFNACWPMNLRELAHRLFQATVRCMRPALGLIEMIDVV